MTVLLFLPWNGEGKWSVGIPQKRKAVGCRVIPGVGGLVSLLSLSSLLESSFDGVDSSRYARRSAQESRFDKNVWFPVGAEEQETDRIVLCWVPLGSWSNDVQNKTVTRPTARPSSPAAKALRKVTILLAYGQRCMQRTRTSRTVRRRSGPAKIANLCHSDSHTQKKLKSQRTTISHGSWLTSMFMHFWLRLGGAHRRKKFLVVAAAACCTMAFFARSRVGPGDPAVLSQNFGEQPGAPCDADVQHNKNKNHHQSSSWCALLIGKVSITNLIGDFGARMSFNVALYSV